MELKNITEVTLKSTPELTENVIVEDNGVAKRVPISAIKTGGGSGSSFDVVITGKAIEQEESGEGDSIELKPDPETVTVETSLSFDELKEKWYYLTVLFGFDGSELEYKREFGASFGFSTIYPGGSDENNTFALFSMSAEAAAQFAEMGIQVSEGDDVLMLTPQFPETYIYPEDSGDSGIGVHFYSAFIFTKGSNGEIVVTCSDIG